MAEAGDAELPGRPPEVARTLQERSSGSAGQVPDHPPRPPRSTEPDLLLQAVDPGVARRPLREPKSGLQDGPGRPALSNPELVSDQIAELFVSHPARGTSGRIIASRERGRNGCGSSKDQLGEVATANRNLRNGYGLAHPAASGSLWPLVATQQSEDAFVPPAPAHVGGTPTGPLDTEPRVPQNPLGAEVPDHHRGGEAVEAHPGESESTAQPDRFRPQATPPVFATEPVAYLGLSLGGGPIEQSDLPDGLTGLDRDDREGLSTMATPLPESVKGEAPAVHAANAGWQPPCRLMIAEDLVEDGSV